MLVQGQQKTGKVDQQHSEHLTSVGLYIKRVQVFDWPACSPDLLSIEKRAKHALPLSQRYWNLLQELNLK